MTTYILTWHTTTEGSTLIELIGPFDHNYTACTWADSSYDSNPNNPYDTPCWQIVNIPVAAPGQPGQPTWPWASTSDFTDYRIPVRSPDSGPLK